MSFGTLLVELGIKFGVLVIICNVREKFFDIVLEICTFLNGHDGKGLEGCLIKIDNLSFGW